MRAAIGAGTASRNAPRYGSKHIHAAASFRAMYNDDHQKLSNDFKRRATGLICAYIVTMSLDYAAGGN
jgi:hypothetical protein